MKIRNKNAFSLLLQMKFEYDIINIKEMLMGLLDWLFGTSNDNSTKKNTTEKSRDPWLYDDECDDCGDPVEDCECDDCDGDCEDD